MTDTKPTPQTDAIDTYQPFIVSEPKYNAMAELCRTLERELAAIKSQPVPVEPECVKYLAQYEQADEDGIIVKVSRQAIHETIAHIDSLQSALQVAQQERDAAKKQVLDYGGLWDLSEYKSRAEKAEELVRAAEKARRNAEAVREGWRTGAITSCDGKSGKWSSENVGVEVALREALAKLEKP